MSEYILSVLDFELKLYKGVSAKERSVLQSIWLNINIIFPQKPHAMATDSIKDTICYDEIVTKILKKYNHKEFKTLEYLAGQLHSHIKKQVKSEAKVELEVKKQPDIEGFGGFTTFKILES